MTHVPAVAATCVKAGNIEYWHCAACNKNYSDENGTTEVTEIVTAINAVNHTKLTHFAKVEPTCVKAGNIEYWHCSGCNKNYTDAAGTQEIADVVILINPDKHTVLTHVSAADATCVKAGNKEYWHCAACKKNYSDAAAANELDDVVKPINPENHVSKYLKGFKAATETEDGYSGDICCYACHVTVTTGTTINKLPTKTVEAVIAHPAIVDEVAAVESIEVNETEIVDSKLTLDIGSQIELTPEAPAEVKTVTLSQAVVETVTQAANLEIKLTNSTVVLDKSVLEGLQTATEIKLEVNDKVETREIENVKQKNTVAEITAVEEVKSCKAVDLNLTAGDIEIHELGGTATVGVPYNCSSNSELRAIYIDDNGNREDVNVAYKNGIATITVSHFSLYLLYEVQTEDDFILIPTVKTLTFDTNGGSELPDKRVFANASVDLSKCITEKTGYEFDGWYSDEKLTQKIESINVSKNTTVYAKWKLINPFTDVDSEAYYYKAIMWAVENGIAYGETETIFTPDSFCTRAQAVTFLWRVIGRPEAEAAECIFDDVDIDSDYYDAVMWAVENGITNGTSETEFSPDETITRAQAVTFLWRTAGKIKSESANPFEDVAENEYYYDAVIWAVENGITNGTSETEFSPEDVCTRAEIVTFLYRYLAE